MPVYKYIPIPEVSQIWNALGTFWAEFEDKGLIEAFWSGLLTAAKLTQRDLYYLTLSRTLSTLPAIIESEHDYHTIYFSGVNQNVTHTNNEYFFDLPKYTYYISGLAELRYSGLTNSYSLSGLSPSDYNFTASGEYKLILYNIPSGVENRQYYIPLSKKINPSLIDVHGKSIGYDISLWQTDKYTPFVTAFGNDYTNMSSATGLMTYIDLKALNLKYFIWGLSYLQKNAISISGFQKALNLVAGRPFTWYSGIVAKITSNTITVDHGDQYQYRYITYSGNVVEPGYTSFTHTLISGQVLSAFDSLVNQTLQVDDVVTNPTLITGLVINTFQYPRSLVIDIADTTLSGVTTSNHDGLFFTYYYKQLLPKSLKVYLYGRGQAYGLSGLIPLPAVEYIGPYSKNITVGSRTSIPLNWYPVPYADSYNVYHTEGTTSGFGGTPVFYQNTENSTINFYPTLSGVLTHWVRWKVHPVTQGFESPNADIVMFSYTRIG